MTFADTSTAGSATITNNIGNVYFNGTSTAGGATITNNVGSSMTFADTSTAGSASITSIGASLSFNNTSTAGTATISTEFGAVYFNDTSTAGSATITNNGPVHFNDSSTAGSATIDNNRTLSFNDTSNAGSATIDNSSFVYFFDTSTAGSAAITNNSQMLFRDTSTAGSATITNNIYLYFFNNSTAGSAAITNNGFNGKVDFSGTTGPNSDHRISAGSIAGDGNYFLGANELTVGSNNLSTEVSGVISDGDLLNDGLGGTGASLVKTGTGTLTLSGVNTYTGATSVDGGALIVNGSIATSSSLTMNSGTTLSGAGFVPTTVINSGATLAPGNPTGTLTVSGDLTFTGGTTYAVAVSPTAAGRTDVSGTATLTGATVQATVLATSFRQQTYTILDATGGLGGTQFTGLNVAGSFSPVRNPRLTYDANDVYLVLDPSVLQLPSGASGSQAGVVSAINGAVARGFSPPAAFDALLAMGGAQLTNALNQLSGETAAGSQQTTFQAMSQFMGLLTDPFNPARETDASAPLAYADTTPARAARDAYAMLTKAPPKTFTQRWNVWAAGFGGSQTTDGNAAMGSNTTTSSVYGSAVGAEYWFSPRTVAGFALAGGGTSFSVAGGGSGRSDLFQAGAYVRHNNGPSYISAALAYGWQDITTDRTVTAAGVDRLRANFDANAFSGRIESGYRFVSSAFGGIGLTPYAAGQVTVFDLPSYAEQAVSGANTFALSYASKDVASTRSELGVRADKSYALSDAILTLRGRAAWAHDFDPDRAIGATFQTLPGASFVVNGAAQASDSALVTAAAEMKWLNGFSMGAAFEGEFSDVTRSYAGKGVVRYAW